MPRDSTGATKSRTVVFPKKDGVSANVTVVVTAMDTDRALAVARQALHATADQAASGITIT